MSTSKPPPPIDPDALDEYLQELADDAELERIAGLSHAEVVEELKKEGVDVARGHAVIDRALEQAAGGSGRGDAGGTGAARATGTGVASGGGGQGTGSAMSGGATSATETGTGTPDGTGKGGAKVVSLTAARARRVRAIAAAGAIAAGAATVFELFGPSVGVNVAHPAPDDDGGHVESAHAKAEKLRDRAEALVVEGYYGEATDALDAAKALDPEGEGEARVKKAREAIGKAGGG